ncbi:hypothetical protein F5148DRAFT_784537 [Russula earlei]|uniref:Uncharacterized protein n=1 Tax=Russula earlei TaxID=71964 RepID=A0ACC0TTU2_9AGAM|nr:hypothetical protein F5148DRAFT_784537 [Russula earlei]
MSTLGESNGFFSDSEEELDWEEVAVPQLEQVEVELEDQAGPSTRPHIEVTLEAYPTQRKGGTQKKLPGAISHAERLLRVDCHKVHTVALIANASTRNRWINDELLQARLLSLTPLPIQNSFAMIHKSRIPDDVKRGYLFEQAVSRLASWWADTFFTVKSLGHLRSRTFEDVQRALLSNGLIDITGKGKGKALPPDADLLEELFENDKSEIVRSPKSLMKHALMRSGSRDVSSQLFTALCRALGIPARLVVSLQSVPWQMNVGRSKTSAKHKESGSKGKAIQLRDAEDSGEDLQEVGVSRPNGYLSGDDMQVDEVAVDEPLPAMSNDKVKVSYAVKLGKSKSPGQRLDSPRPATGSSDPLATPAVFWTEVFSRPDGRWIPVDPIRAIVNKRKVFDPTRVGASSRTATVDNRMMYVLAIEEDGYMRDVTPRYAKQYSAKVAKAQSGGRGRREWWARVVGMVTRPYRLHRDDVEDDELIVNQFTEGMPTTIGGFKNHPFYVLERHLLRDQIISQDAHELGKFRGESVYSRSQVLQLKAAENWMRHGRVVRMGEQPLKYVKQRAMTLNRRRELEIRADVEGANSGGEAMQGLYAESQTEIYVPPPVVDGKIPKNSFGNIDLYVPSMLPSGAIHIPRTSSSFLPTRLVLSTTRSKDKGVAKIARQLGFDHAEAVTGFDFRKGKAFPVLSGIVVAAENEDVIVEAYWEAEHVAAEKEQEKRQQAVLKRWTKLVQGLRIRQRMREQYGNSQDVRGRGIRDEGDVRSSLAAAGNEDGEGETRAAYAGGFLTGVEDVVQPYSLPRPMHAVFSSPPRSPNSAGRASPALPIAPPASAGPTTPGGDTPRLSPFRRRLGRGHRGQRGPASAHAVDICRRGLGLGDGGRCAEPPASTTDAQIHGQASRRIGTCAGTTSGGCGGGGCGGAADKRGTGSGHVCSRGGAFAHHPRGVKIKDGTGADDATNGGWEAFTCTSTSTCAGRRRRRRRRE